MADGSDREVTQADQNNTRSNQRLISAFEVQEILNEKDKVFKQGSNMSNSNFNKAQKCNKTCVST